MPKLIINPGTAQAREIELKQGSNYLGRGFDNDFRIEDPSVSVAHLQIDVAGNAIMIRDLNSTNGTFINRARVADSQLQPGQLLHLGRVEVLYAGDMSPTAVAAGLAPTMAIPHPAGSRVPFRSTTPAGIPSTPPGPAATAVPAPTPVIAAAPTPQPFTPIPRQSVAPAPVIGAHAAPVASRQPSFAPRRKPAGLFRCLAFGFGAAVLTGGLWIWFVTKTGTSPAPYAPWVAGAISGLGLRLASRNRSGAMYSLLATGFCLLGIFIGELGQAFAIQTVNFQGYNLAGLAAGAVSAWFLGGGEFVAASSARSRMAA